MKPPVGLTWSSRAEENEPEVVARRETRMESESLAELPRVHTGESWKAYWRLKRGFSEAWQDKKNNKERGKRRQGKGPGRKGAQGQRVLLPVQARLSLVRLLPSRASLRLAGHREYSLEKRRLHFGRCKFAPITQNEKNPNWGLDRGLFIEGCARGARISPRRRERRARVYPMTAGSGDPRRS